MSQMKLAFGFIMLVVGFVLAVVGIQMVLNVHHDLGWRNNGDDHLGWTCQVPSGSQSQTCSYDSEAPGDLTAAALVALSMTVLAAGLVAGGGALIGGAQRSYPAPAPAAAPQLPPPPPAGPPGPQPPGRFGEPRA
jgi:hypothetical protein